MTYWYRVQTICAATIRETWTVRSDAPLPRAALEQIVKLAGDGEPAGHDVTPVDEEMRVEEGERVVFEVVNLQVDAVDHPGRPN
jgi:hypothetical protein